MLNIPGTNAVDTKELVIVCQVCFTDIRVGYFSHSVMVIHPKRNLPHSGLMKHVLSVGEFKADRLQRNSLTFIVSLP